MKQLWKVKGFEQHKKRTHVFHIAFFSVENEQNNETDMYMPPLVHVRTLFFFFSFSSLFSSLSLLSSSLLSSFIFFPFTVSGFSLSVSVRCCVGVVFGVSVCVCWERGGGGPCVR